MQISKAEGAASAKAWGRNDLACAKHSKEASTSGTTVEAEPREVSWSQILQE